jgi:membrane protease YdiL (CAAX protease family)
MNKLSLASKLLIISLILAAPGFGFIIAAYSAGQLLGFGLALQVVLAIGALAAGMAILLFTVGVGVYVFAPLRAPGRADRQYSSYATILGCLYLAVVIANILGGLYLLIQPGGIDQSLGSGADGTTGANSLIVAAAMQELVILAILYFRIIRPRVISWPAMGLNTHKLPRRIAIGLCTAVVVLVVNGVLTALLAAIGLRSTQSELISPILGASPLQFFVFLLVVAVLTGLVEESFFRGYVFHALYQTRGAWRAYVGSALIFAALHFPSPDSNSVTGFLADWLAIMLPVLALGLIFAYVYHRSGSIVPTIVAHVVNNGVALTALYLSWVRS